MRQAEGGIFLPAQIALCAAYCARQCWGIAATFVDPGVSAYDDDWPQFHDIIHQATRDKKRLFIPEGEAATVPKIFDLVLGVDALWMGGNAL